MSRFWIFSKKIHFALSLLLIALLALSSLSYAYTSSCVGTLPAAEVIMVTSEPSSHVTDLGYSANSCHQVLDSDLCQLNCMLAHCSLFLSPLPITSSMAYHKQTPPVDVEQKIFWYGNEFHPELKPPKRILAA